MKTTMSRTYRTLVGVMSNAQAREAMTRRAQTLLENDPYYAWNVKQLSTRIHQGKIEKDMMRRVQPSIAAESFRLQGIPLVEARRLLPLVAGWL